MKRLISFALVICVALLSLASVNINSDITANAVSEDSLFNTLTCRQIQELHPAITYTLKDELLNMTEDISLDTKYKVPDKYIMEIFISILCESPELFYVDPHIVEVSISNPDNTLISIRPTYLFTKQEIQEKQQELDNAADKIISGIGSDWTNMEKCRYVHDMIALNCRYYESNVETDNYSVYTAYGALVDGEAYCEGYTLAFNYIMKKLGIPTAYIQSLKVNHSWSLVNIDGYYYHVDVAYDDPTPDTIGRVYHDFCIVSDGQMNAYDNDSNNSFKHTDWVSSLKADNDMYNLAWWRGVETGIFKANELDYYINHLYGASEYGALLAYNNNSGSISEINKIENRWYVEGTSDIYWKGNYSYLSYDGEYIYYNDTTNVYRLKPGSTQRELFYSKPSSIKNYIYGFSMQLDGKFYISSKATPNDSDNLHEINYNVITASTDLSQDTLTPTENTQPTKASTIITITPEVQIPVSTYSRCLKVGKSYKLSVKNLDSKTKLTYKSSNSKIVKTTSTGNLIALKKGKATVTMTLHRNKSVIGKVKCKITIKKDPSLSAKSVTVKKKQSVSVKIRGKASSINNKYTNTAKAKIISKPSSATIKVKGLKKGKTTLKIKVNGVKTLKLTVKIK